MPSRERSLARSLPSNCALSSSYPACLPTPRRSAKIASHDALDRMLVPTAQLVSGGIRDLGVDAIRTQLFDSCQRLRASTHNRIVDQVDQGLAESAPLGGMHHARQSPAATAVSLIDELDALDKILVQLASDEMPLDTIDLLAEMMVLLLRQAWRQWLQEPCAGSSQSLSRATALCAFLASRAQCRHSLLVHRGLPALVYMLLGRWEGEVAPEAAPGQPSAPPTSMAVVEAACQVRCCRLRTRTPARTPPHTHPRARTPAHAHPRAPPHAHPPSLDPCLSSETNAHERTARPSPRASTGDLPAELRRGVSSLCQRRGRRTGRARPSPRVLGRHRRQGSPCDQEYRDARGPLHRPRQRGRGALRRRPRARAAPTPHPPLTPSPRTPASPLTSPHPSPPPTPPFSHPLPHSSVRTCAPTSQLDHRAPAPASLLPLTITPPMACLLRRRCRRWCARVRSTATPSTCASRRRARWATSPLTRRTRR